ncbi:putative D-xylulose kinase A [Cyphellophora attinorum]|uniref:Xylulose kinase n=1 Tax=Cyphellophora attinorum TaxID=1664694 RepID=A0A0N1HGY4_9EURO|nr:putative D-xylulose kinase A [Phialophora attinorum]KPI45033.1 putative D-xylulose kinase A [Phialophora attinorum]
MSGPLYIGTDLSTQQLKALVVDSTLKKVYEAKFDFDADSKGYDIRKGVMTNEAEGEVFAPVTLWLQAVDTVLARLKDAGLDFLRVKGISGAGMQHGSVFWNTQAEQVLGSLDPSQGLEKQVDKALAHPFSPNWQDASTQKECDEFDAILGSEVELANATGSKAHHRFTGPQILRFSRKHPEAYQKTHRITLVSSWLATIFRGKLAPFDISDVCGMNLWDIPNGRWHPKLLELASGKFPVDELKSKLGDVPEDGGEHLGRISDYFVKRYGFSLIPDPATHFFNSPTTAGIYMFMLCYKNGGLAREYVRDAINNQSSILAGTKHWEMFDRELLAAPPLAASDSKPAQLGLYFPRPEIIPNLPQGEWHYEYDPESDELSKTGSVRNAPAEDARIIVESQMLSLRLRSQDLVQSPADGLPPQPRRIYVVGGGSRNKAIAKVAGEVLGGSDGVWKLDVGENACALGSAYKAVWAVERKQGETFEDLIGKRWRESEFAEKIADGYNKECFEKYGKALKGFERMEKELLQEHGRK